MRVQIFIAVLLLITGCAAEPPVNPILSEGQVWKYHARNNEESSTLTILKIEKEYEQDVVIVSVSGVKIQHYEKGEVNTIPFLPFPKSVILGDVTELVGISHNIPDFSEQYNSWVGY